MEYKMCNTTHHRHILRTMQHNLLEQHRNIESEKDETHRKKRKKKNEFITFIFQFFLLLSDL